MITGEQCHMPPPYVVKHVIAQRKEAAKSCAPAALVARALPQNELGDIAKVTGAIPVRPQRCKDGGVGLLLLRWGKLGGRDVRHHLPRLGETGKVESQRLRFDLGGDPCLRQLLHKRAGVGEGAGPTPGTGGVGAKRPAVC